MAWTDFSELDANNRIAVEVRWRELGPVFFIPLIVFCLLTPHIVDWLNPPTGDEPFYLTTAISLIQDHDLDETNQYLNHDYWQFYPTCLTVINTPQWGSSSSTGHATDNTPGVSAPGIPCLNLGNFQYLPPHTSQGVLRPGQYTKHGVGLSFLIAPAYVIGGRIGTVFFMNFLAALLGVNLFLLAYETTRRRRIAWLVWATLLFSVPFLSYAFLIFPATPAALCLVYAWRRLRLASQARIWARENNVLVPVVNNALQLALVAVCIGFLPWLHSVYLSLALPLVLYMWLGGRDVWRNSWRWLRLGHFTFGFIAEDISLIGFAVSFAILTFFGGLFLLFYLYYYGTPLPNTQDHAGFTPLTWLWDGILGFLFDQKYGLLMYAPYYLLALAGISLLWFKPTNQAYTASRHSDLGWLALVAGPYFLIMSDYNQWWGEWCPPARYLMPILPLLALPFALALDEMRSWLARGFYSLAAVWSFAAAILVMYNPHLEFDWQSSNPAKILLFLQQNVPFLHEQNVGAWFPAYVTPIQPAAGIGFWLAPLLWAIGALGLAVAMVWQTLHQRSSLCNVWWGRHNLDTPTDLAITQLSEHRH